MINKEDFLIQKLSKSKGFKISNYIKIGMGNIISLWIKIENFIMISYLLLRNYFIGPMNQKLSIYGMEPLRFLQLLYVKKDLTNNLNPKECGEEDFILLEILNILLKIIHTN